MDISHEDPQNENLFDLVDEGMRKMSDGRSTPFYTKGNTVKGGFDDFLDSVAKKITGVMENSVEKEAAENASPLRKQ